MQRALRRTIVTIAIFTSLLPIHAVSAAVPVEKQIPSTQPADGAGTKVAVYDVNKVAHDLGWTTDMQSSVDVVKHKFEQELEHSKEMYRGQIIDQKKKWAPKETDKLTPNQEQILNSMNTYGSEVLKQMAQNAAQLLISYRQQWIAEYHRALRPILEQVAEERTLAIILEKNESVQFVRPSSDITDMITDAARDHPPVINPVQAPQLPDPGPMTLKWPDTQPADRAP